MEEREKGYDGKEAELQAMLNWRLKEIGNKPKIDQLSPLKESVLGAETYSLFHRLEGF